MLARVAPAARVIDVTHGIPRGDVRAGALALTRAVQYLPEGVVLAVVDPGVGTDRRAIAAETSVGYFVGPDNGLLSPAVAMVGGASRVVSIENPEVRIPSTGQTFWGRDVFAPAAGVLAAGSADLDDLGPELDPDEVMPLLLPLPQVEPGKVVGEVLWIDVFGNAETNIGPADLELAGFRLGDEVEVLIGGTVHRVPWRKTYGDVEPGRPVLHVDSAGLVALAVRGGRADQRLGLTVGAGVTLSGGSAGSRPG